MEISAAIIQRFFDRTCTAEEAELIADHFYSNPDLLEGYFIDEWKQTEADVLTSGEVALLLQNIRQHIYSKKPVLRRIKIASAVAASMLLVIGLTMFLKVQRSTTARPTTEMNVPVIARWMIKRNSTGKAMRITLEDSSVVRLEPGSSIKYQLFDGLKARDIYLTGEALFKVVKDRTKPFTVYTGNLATTVLGTQFDVGEDEKRIMVELYEGKVTVRPLSPVNNWTRPVDLAPGQILVFNRLASSVEVRTMTRTGRSANTDKYEKDTLNTSLVTGNPNWYMFNNQSLSNVFGQLEELYNVKIAYRPEDVKNVYFIGRFNKTDSIEAILNNIALLKKLQIQHKD